MKNIMILFKSRYSKRNRDSLKGFSLIELCISIAIMGILAVIFAPVMSMGIESALFNLDRNYVIREARGVLHTMAMEISRADVIDDSDSASITFHPAGIPPADRVTFTSSGTSQENVARSYFDDASSSTTTKTITLCCDNPPCCDSPPCLPVYFEYVPYWGGVTWNSCGAGINCNEVRLVRIQLRMNRESGSEITLTTSVRLRNMQ
ncbi:MAG: type II secretion system GspH family protein [Candidatus Omnitrophica bacterium]|nr:type II secretion system GspH family protein [Candidatus Omnitrophota bacterium]